MFKILLIMFPFLISNCLYQLKYINKVDETENQWKTEEIQSSKKEKN
jgi:hypothetical protein